MKSSVFLIRKAVLEKENLLEQRGEDQPLRRAKAQFRR